MTRQKSAHKTLPPEEISLFLEQIAMALKAGIPLHDAMETLAESYGDGRYGARFGQIRDSVQQSGSLSTALCEAGGFPAYVIGMLKIGERAGKLDDVTSALSNYYQWEADVRTSVKSAILYPATLVVMLGAVIAILVVSVLPVFSEVFESLGISSGTAAGAAMRVGVGVGKAMLVVTGLIALFLAVIAILLGTSRRAYVIDALSKALPPVRRASRKLSAGRFASVVSILLTAGCSIDDALSLAPEVVSDGVYRARILACAERVSSGEPFSQAVASERLFEPIHEKMIRFGAAAGQLDAVMEKLRALYMEEADDAIRYLVSMIEPTLVSVLCVVIGGVLLTVMLPLLSILSSMG